MPDWETLVNDALAGHEEAFAQIYEQTRDNVFRTTCLIATSGSDTESILQEVYVELWRSLRQYDRRRPFLAWLHGIVINKIRSYSRTRWRYWRTVQKLQRTDCPEELTYSPEPADRAVARQQTDDLLLAVRQLSPKLREVIVFRYYHDYTLTETARILHIPAGTARSRHHEALRQLRIAYHSVSEKEVAPCLPYKT